ncbi:MAG: DUF3307 domain-containing protein [Bacteroidota bacterium]
MEFIVVLIGHWVGDFLFQTGRMATFKSSSLKWLSLHVLTYTLVLLCIGYFIFSWQVAVGYAIFNGALHLITDFFTSKLAKSYREKPRIFYPVLGLDQLVHSICLYWTFINSDLLAL